MVKAQRVWSLLRSPQEVGARLTNRIPKDGLKSPRTKKTEIIIIARRLPTHHHHHHHNLHYLTLWSRLSILTGKGTCHHDCILHEHKTNTCGAGYDGSRAESLPYAAVSHSAWPSHTMTPHQPPQTVAIIEISFINLGKFLLYNHHYLYTLGVIRGRRLLTIRSCWLANHCLLVSLCGAAVRASEEALPPPCFARILSRTWTGKPAERG